MPKPELIGSGHFIGINFVGTRFDIEGDEVAFMCAFQTRMNIVFIDIITPLGKFLFAIPGMREFHIQTLPS